MLGSGMQTGILELYGTSAPYRNKRECAWILQLPHLALYFA